VSVIVNEWEIVPESADQAGQRTPAPAPQAPQPPSPNEIERALRILSERAVRLRAD
jgi:hypothetical protein